MPKAKRKQIAQRGQIEVNDSGGSSNVPAAIRASAMSPGGGGAVVASDRYANSGFLALSGTLRELARRAEKEEDRAYAEAQREQAKAEARAEKERAKAELLADLQEARAVSIGLIREKHATLEGIRSGEISAEQLYEKINEINSLGDGRSEQVQTAVYKAATVLYEDGLVSLASQQKTRNNERAENILTDSLDALTRSLSTASFEEFEDGIVAARQASIAYGKTPEAVEQEMLTSLMKRALTLPEKEAYTAHDYILRLAERGTLTASTLEGGEALSGFRISFADAMIRKDNETEKMMREKEALQQQKALSGINNRFQSETPEGKQRIIEEMRARPDEFQAVLGNRYGDVLHGFEQAYREAVGWVETTAERVSTREALRLQRAHQSGEIALTYKEIDLNPRLTDKGKLTMRGYLDSKLGQRNALIQETYEAAVKAYEDEVEKKKGFFQDHTNALVKSRNESGMLAEIVAAYEIVDEQDVDAIRQRKDALLFAADRGKRKAFAGEYLKDLKIPDPSEELDSPKKWLTAITTPPPGVTVAPGEVYVNAKKLLEVPEEKKQEVYAEFQRITTERLRAAAELFDKAQRDAVAIEQVDNRLMNGTYFDPEFIDPLYVLTLEDLKANNETSPEPPPFPFMDEPEVPTLRAPLGSGKDKPKAETLETLRKEIESSVRKQ